MEGVESHDCINLPSSNQSLGYDPINCLEFNLERAGPLAFSQKQSDALVYRYADCKYNRNSRNYLPGLLSPKTRLTVWQKAKRLIGPGGLQLFEKIYGFTSFVGINYFHNKAGMN